MFRVRDVNRSSFCVSADVENFECSLLERNLQQKGGQQGDSEPGDGRIAHEQAVIDAEGHLRSHNGEFAIQPKAPVRRTSIAVVPSNRGRSVTA